jgi:hypothetical protein
MTCFLPHRIDNSKYVYIIQRFAPFVKGPHSFTYNVAGRGDLSWTPRIRKLRAGCPEFCYDISLDFLIKIWDNADVCQGHRAPSIPALTRGGLSRREPSGQPRRKGWDSEARYWRFFIVAVADRLPHVVQRTHIFFAGFDGTSGLSSVAEKGLDVAGRSSPANGVERSCSGVGWHRVTCLRR